MGWLEEVEGSTRFFFLNLDADPLIGAPQSLGARVRRTPPTYGGTWAWRDDASVVVVASDARVVLLDLEPGAENSLENSLERSLIDDAPSGLASRYLAPSVSNDGEWLAVSRERTDAMEIVVVSIDSAFHARAAHEHSVEPTVISSSDFAWDPTWSPDGALLAWHEWSNPDMPWDSSRIVVADFHGGVVSNQRVVAGGPDTQVGQPRFSPDGTRLAWLTDSDGWLRVYVGDIDGSNAALLNDELVEAGEAPWGAGQRSYAWSADSKHIAWCRNENGFGRLVCAEVGDEKSGHTEVIEPEVIEPEILDIAKAWHHGVSWGPLGIAAIRSGARTPPRVVLYPHSAEASSRGIEFSERVEIADGDPIGFDKATFSQGCLVEPKVLSWMSGDLEITGLLYLPPGVENAPLIFDLHGGPTGAATARWSPNVAALLSHGWAVIRPNPRGSYGSGRAHLRALDGGWGASDLDDVIAGIEAVSSAADVDSMNLNPPRIAITGGSAGGMLALLVALLCPDLVKACISVYGVTDLLSLAETDYRFEKHYAQRLVGELPEARDLYVERSPITHAHRLSVPTLMLHGDADEVVPVTQMREFVSAARAGGAVIESHEYAGEGHGWSRPETIRDDFDRSVAFLEKWL